MKTGAQGSDRYRWPMTLSFYNETIPGRPGDDVPMGTLKSISKAAGVETKP
jgi:hypothetical protein